MAADCCKSNAAIFLAAEFDLQQLADFSVPVALKTDCVPDEVAHVALRLLDRTALSMGINVMQLIKNRKQFLFCD